MKKEIEINELHNYLAENEYGLFEYGVTGWENSENRPAIGEVDGLKYAYINNNGDSIHFIDYQEDGNVIIEIEKNKFDEVSFDESTGESVYTLR